MYNGDFAMSWMIQIMWRYLTKYPNKQNKLVYYSYATAGI